MLAFLILASRSKRGQGMLKLFHGSFSWELYLHLFVKNWWVLFLCAVQHSSVTLCRWGPKCGQIRQMKVCWVKQKLDSKLLFVNDVWWSFFLWLLTSVVRCKCFRWRTKSRWRTGWALRVERGWGEGEGARVDVPHQEASVVFPENTDFPCFSFKFSSRQPATSSDFYLFKERKL